MSSRGIASTLKSVNLFGHSCEIVHASFGSEPFDKHVHDEFSIGLILSGVNVFGYRNSLAAADIGSVCVADPGEPHDGGLAGSPWSYVNLFAPAALVDDLLGERGHDAPLATAEPVSRAPELVAAAKSFFRRVALIEEDSDRVDGLVDDVGLELIDRLFVANGVKPLVTPACEDCVAQRALSLIRDVRGVGVSLDILARETGVERYRVVRSVRRALGVTPMAYALHLRAAEAKKLILAGVPIVDAALAAGFSDQAHLTRRMKRLFGVTPGQLKHH